jgi:TIR domain-containing protein
MFLIRQERHSRLKESSIAKVIELAREWKKMGYIFMSYSRRQLYFAESVVLNLQRAGLEIWFGLQKLSPGIDLASALKDGYSNCDKLILIASRHPVTVPADRVGNSPGERTQSDCRSDRACGIWYSLKRCGRVPFTIPPPASTRPFRN